MTAIEFQNVGKQYHLGTVGTGTLSHDLNRWWQTAVLRREDPYLKIGETNDRSKKGTSDFVWALRDVSFKVEEGDVVGIIGKNGAGKSTLLKLLSNITAPTTGRISYRGRIASLLEVGTGFHPEMTGRENIYMNGSIMGMTKHEIKAKLDEIVDFAGVARYLDTPVKRYSSGMTVRLGFAVAAFLEPEILVVDEVLTVGDAEFQKKAVGKMKDVSESGGRTVLFVSHNMAAVKKLCKHGVLLENGMVSYTGDVKETVERYISSGARPSSNITFTDLSQAPGNDNIRIQSFSLNPLAGNTISIDSGFRVKLVFKNFKPDIMLDATFELRTLDDIVIFHKGKVVTPEKDAKVGFYSVWFDIPKFTLNTGRYQFRIWFGENQKYLLWGFYNHVFEVENSFLDQGYNMSVLPGILKPEYEMSYAYLGQD